MEDDVLLMVVTVVDVAYQTSLCIEVGLLEQFSAASPLPIDLSPFTCLHLFSFSFPARICFVLFPFSLHSSGMAMTPNFKLDKTKQSCLL